MTGKNGRKMRRGLTKRIGIAVAVMIFFIGILLIIFSYQAFYRIYIQFCCEKAQGIVRTLAGEMDGDSIAGYLEKHETDMQYEQWQEVFNHVKEHTAGLSYLYVFVPKEDYFIYIIDAYARGDEQNNISKLGDTYSYGETEYNYLIPDIKNKKPSTEIIYGEDQGFGKSISAWAPVLDSKGNVAAVVEADYELEGLQRQVHHYMLAEVLFLSMAMLLCFLIMLGIIKRGVTNPLARLSAYMNSYENGNSDHMDFIYNREDEIKQLTVSFKNLIDRINRYIELIEEAAAERERTIAEMGVATHIQANMLPNKPPNRKEIDLIASMTPAKEVGGDFYDFFFVDDSRLVMVIADVSGKGVPAALFMVIAKTLIKNHAMNSESPAEIFTNVNTQLCENNKEDMFVTAWLGILDVGSGSLVFVNAGHNPPLLTGDDGKFEFIRSKAGLVLAGAEGIRYQQQEVKLKEGDKLFLYTDGVTEAMNEQQQFFGENRLKDVMNKNKDFTVSQILSAVRKKIGSFVGREPQFDDITMLCMEYRKEPS